VRLGILMTPHSTKRNSPLMSEVLALLSQWNVKVDTIYPEDHVTPLAGLRAEHDLYVLKAQTELAHSIAGALHAVGAPILNPWPVAVMIKDKVAALRRLMAAGIPIPETFVISSSHRLAALLEDGPMVVKPSRASKDRGTRIVWDADEVEEVMPGGGPLLAQRYHKPDGADEADRKIYCIGGQLFGVVRKASATTVREKCGEPFTITRSCATSRCGPRTPLASSCSGSISSSAMAARMSSTSTPSPDSRECPTPRCGSRTTSTPPRGSRWQDSS